MERTVLCTEMLSKSTDSLALCLSATWGGGGGCSLTPVSGCRARQSTSTCTVGALSPHVAKLSRIAMRSLYVPRLTSGGTTNELIYTTNYQKRPFIHYELERGLPSGRVRGANNRPQGSDCGPEDAVRGHLQARCFTRI